MTATIGHNNPPPLKDIFAESYAELLGAIEPLAEQANAAPKEIESDADLLLVGQIVVDASKLGKQLEAARKKEKQPFDDAGKEVQAFFNPLKERIERIASTLEARATAYQRKVADEARRRAEEEARMAREEADRQREIARKAEEANRAKTAAKHEDRAEEAEQRAFEAETAAQASAADLTRVRGTSGTLATSRTEWAFEVEDYNKIPLETLRPYLARTDVEKAIRSFVRVNKNLSPLAGVRIFEDVRAKFR